MSEARRSGWSALVVERFALPPLLLVSLAQATSAQYVVRPSLDVAGLAVAALGVTSLLALLRLMDELKDLHKDRIAHPERPLPRGALPVDEARKGVVYGSTALVLSAAGIALGLNPTAGALYGACVVFAILMYREFWISKYLEARPLLYALTHQVIAFPIYAFATAVAEPSAAFSAPALWFAMSGLGASFTMEVCRKLDPGADPALRTYLHQYGPSRTMVLVAVALVVVAAATQRIGVHLIVWPAVLAVLATLPLLRVRPRSFKWIAGAAALLVVVQPLAPTLVHVWSFR